MLREYAYASYAEMQHMLSGGVLGRAIPITVQGLVGETLSFAVPLFSCTFVDGATPGVLTFSEIKAQLETASAGALTVTRIGERIGFVETEPTMGCRLSTANELVKDIFGFVPGQAGQVVFPPGSASLPQLATQYWSGAAHVALVSTQPVGAAQLSLGYTVPYVAGIANMTSLVGGPCDAVKVPADDLSIAYESADGPDTLPGVRVTGATPTLGTGWVDNGDGTYTHTAGEVEPLIWSDRMCVNAVILSKFTISSWAAGTVSASAGTTTGALVGVDGPVREILQVAGDQHYRITPSADFEGTISAVDVLPFSEPLASKEWHPLRCNRIESVINVDFVEQTTAILRLGWYRKPVK